MNEAETRAEHVAPALKAAGRGVVEGSRVLRELGITLGRLQGSGGKGGQSVRAKAAMADYVLVYRNTKLAVIVLRSARNRMRGRRVGSAPLFQSARFQRLRDNFPGELEAMKADQGYNAFLAFPDDALVRIDPADIRKKGRVPKNGSIFQTFTSGCEADRHDVGRIHLHARRPGGAGWPPVEGGIRCGRTRVSPHALRNTQL